MDEKINNGGAVASELGSSSVLHLDKGSKNKRKLDDDPSLENPVNAPLLMSEFSPKIFQSPMVGPLEVGSSGEPLRENSEPGDWDDPIACQLVDLLSSNMHPIFQNAIKKIVECGYEEAVAKKAISGRGLYQGGKDLVSNVVNDALASLKKGKGEDISGDAFEDLQQLVEYTMLEMINVLLEVKPSLSIAEAMWWLLIFDLNISMACEVEGDIFYDVGCKEVLGESSSSSNPQLRSESQNQETILPCPNGPHVSKHSLHCCKHYLPETLKFGTFSNLTNCKGPVAYEALTPEKDSLACVGASRDPVVSVHGGKTGTCRRGCSKKDLAALRKKSFDIEKCKVACGKCAFRADKLATIGGLVVERRARCPSELSVMHMKNASSKRINEAGCLVHECHHVLTHSSHGLYVSDHTSVLPTNGTKSAVPTPKTGLASSSSSSSSSSLSSSEVKSVHKSEGRTSKSSMTPDNGAERKPTPEAKAITSTSSMSTDYFAGIPYDKSLGKYIPQDEEDELILKLVPRLQEVQNELDSWTQWANQKVKQAVCRLNKNQDEIKSLRQEMEEAERLKRKKKFKEENTMKRLSEMEFALDNATNQVEDAHSKLQKLEVEHSALKMEMEVAKLQSAASASSCQEASEREQKALKDVRSWDAQRNLLQEELASEKKNVAELQRKVGKAKRMHNQTMMLWKQERMTMEKFLAQAASIRQERECLEAAAKIQEGKIKMKAEKDMQKYGEEIKKLEYKLSELKLDSSKISSLWRGSDGGNGQCSSVNEGDRITIFSKRAVNTNEYPRSRGLKQERECVMCLTEEKIVVFLPCSHQVFCVKCSELHHKQGMKDCPACRAPIICRIRARFAES